jgi:hypothetical protein
MAGVSMGIYLGGGQKRQVFQSLQALKPLLGPLYTSSLVWALQAALPLC